MDLDVYVLSLFKCVINTNNLLLYYISKVIKDLSLSV